jgi:hypothetical protein
MPLEGRRTHLSCVRGSVACLRSDDHLAGASDEVRKRRRPARPSTCISRTSASSMQARKALLADMYSAGVDIVGRDILAAAICDDIVRRAAADRRTRESKRGR